jgi:hypothetical protein
MDLESHASLTRTLRVLLTLGIWVNAIAVLADVFAVYSYMTVPAGLDVKTVLLPTDFLTGATGVIQAILAIVSGIAFLVWTYRTNKGLRAWSAEPMKFTPGWSVGWYFIPIANLFKPYQVMKEIWSVSHTGEERDDAIVVSWWTLWVVSNFVGRFAFRLILGADDARTYAASAWVYIFSDGIDVVQSAIALRMVTHIGGAYARRVVGRASS